MTSDRAKAAVAGVAADKAAVVAADEAEVVVADEAVVVVAKVADRVVKAAAAAPNTSESAWPVSARVARAEHRPRNRGSLARLSFLARVPEWTTSPR